MPNVWEAANTEFKGKFIAINAYITKVEISQINNLTFYLKELEKCEKCYKGYYYQFDRTGIQID